MADLSNEPLPDQPQLSASDGEADAPASTPIAAGAECPACGYSIGGLPIPRCPECGRAIREIEVRLGQARKMFLELTLVRVVVLPIVLVVVAWWIEHGLMLPAIGGFCILMGAVVGEVFARTTHGPERKLVRRLWWLAVPFAQGTWLTATLYLYVLYLWMSRMYGYGYSRWVFVWGGMSTAESTVVFVIAAAGGLCGWLVWRWRWNRMCALLGIPDTVRTGPALRRAMWIVHMLPLGVIGLLLLVWVIGKLLNLLLDLFPQMYS